MSARDWADLTTTDFASLDVSHEVAVLPVAAVEQHGPHLPLGTDAIINAGVLRRAAELVPSELPLLILPTISVGLSPEHRDFPGTLTLSPETMLRVVLETAESVVHAGLRKILLLNSHGGQPQIMEIVAQDLRARHSVLAIVANTWRLMRARDVLPAVEHEDGIHAGGIETSLLLHLAPHLVRRERIADFKTSARVLAERHPEMAGGGRLRFAWQAQDLNASGAVGDARLATAEIGCTLIEQAAQGLVALVADASRLPLDTLRRK